jgi:hypothetical protein
MYIQYIQGLFQPRLGTADYALVISSLLYNDSLVTLMHSQSQSHSHVTTDDQSVSMSWCQVLSGTRDQMLYSV